MDASLLVSQVVLAVVCLGPGFLLLGALRAFKVGSWRLKQLEIALSGRLGLPPGAKAPAFSLSSVQGARVAPKSFVGRRVEAEPATAETGVA
jgi:hypothetical protein